MGVLNRLSDSVKIIAIYILVASLWVILGNYFVVSKIDSSIDLVRMRSLESGLFILLSSALLWVLMKQKLKVIRDKAEKNQIYVQELHHRVRNNLAVILGIIELKSLELKVESNQHILEELRYRINSLAACQELLYQYKDVHAVPIHKCIQQLAESRLQGSQNGIELQTNLEEVLLNINQAIPLAFIFSEILSVQKQNPEDGMICNIHLAELNGNDLKVVMHYKITGIASGPNLKRIIESDILNDPITDAYTKQLQGNWKLTAGEDQLQMHFKFYKTSYSGSAAHKKIID